VLARGRGAEGRGSVPGGVRHAGRGEVRGTQAEVKGVWGAGTEVRCAMPGRGSVGHEGGGWDWKGVAGE